MSVIIRSQIFGANGLKEQLQDKLVAFASESLANKYKETHEAEAPVVSGDLRRGARVRREGVGRYTVSVTRQDLPAILEMFEERADLDNWWERVYAITQQATGEAGQRAFDAVYGGLLPGGTF